MRQKISWHHTHQTTNTFEQTQGQQTHVATPLILLILSFFCLFSFFFSFEWVRMSPDPWTLDRTRMSYQLWAFSSAVLPTPPPHCGQALATAKTSKGTSDRQKGKQSPSPSPTPTEYPITTSQETSHMRSPGTNPLKQEIERSRVVISKKKWVRREGCLLASEIYDEHKARRKITNQSTGWWTDFR